MSNKDIKILWVEDDISQRETIAEFFEIFGFSGSVAENGKKALEFLDKHPCNVLITDIGMPEMNGWELIALVKRKYGNQIKIIVVSGWAQTIESEMLEKNGVLEVISKPYELGFIKDMLLKL